MANATGKFTWDPTAPACIATHKALLQLDEYNEPPTTIALAGAMKMADLNFFPEDSSLVLIYSLAEAGKFLGLLAKNSGAQDTPANRNKNITALAGVFASQTQTVADLAAVVHKNLNI